MSAEEHSRYSPSAASRWLACPASVKAIEALPKREEEASIYAAQGTRVHKACQELDELGRITTELEEPWMKECVDAIMEQRKKLLPKNCALHTETRVDLEHLGFPEVFGTVDLMVYHRKTVNVIDYKTGKGIPVTADNNPQLMIYALSSAGRYPKAEKFKLVIIQPRIYKEPWTWEITKKDLMAWFEKTLKPGIKAVQEGKKFKPSEEACRWCPVSQAGCKALVDELLDMLPDTEKKPEEYDVSEIKRILDNKKLIVQTIGKLEAYAVKQAEAGMSIPGYKLVKSLGNSAWRDAKKADSYLMRKKFKEKERKTFKLVSPTKAKKMLGERGLLTERTIRWLNNNVFRPERGLILVPESDSRPAVEIDLPTADLEDIL